MFDHRAPDALARHADRLRVAGWSGSISRALNRLFKGNPKESLCGRFTRTRAHDCAFCRVVGWLLKDPDHCWRQRIYELTRR